MTSLLFSTINKLVILDRDGIINHDSSAYIKSEDEFIFLPNSIQAIALLTRAGYKIAIATNQSGISRGYFDEKTLASIHNKMMQAVHEGGGCINAIQYCPHLPYAGCMCRKPMPGMLYAIAKQLDCSLTGVPYIGDRITDIFTAKAAGALPMIVLSQMTEMEDLDNFP